MKHFKYTFFIILVLLMFTTLFYWYEIRPSQIRKNCHIEGKNKMQNDLNHKFVKKVDEEWNNYPQEEKDKLIEKFGSLEKFKESLEKKFIEKITNNFFTDSEMVNFIREEEKYFYSECLGEKGFKE